MTHRLHEKVFIVTGSTSGIGRELSKMLISEGARMVINGRDAGKAGKIDHLFSQHAGQYRYIAADISRPDDCKKLIEETIIAFGRLDGVVLNAALTCRGEVMNLQPGVPEKMIATNLTAAFYLLHYGLPHLKTARGVIIFISSLAAIHGLPGYAPYSATKMAQISLYQSLRKELHGTGVFTGITLLGFTENDPEKTRLGCDGSLEAIPSRKSYRPVSQQKTAARILKQIIRRRPRYSAPSVFGWVASRLSGVFPGLLHVVILRGWKRNKF